MISVIEKGEENLFSSPFLRLKCIAKIKILTAVMFIKINLIAGTLAIKLIEKYKL